MKMMRNMPPVHPGDVLREDIVPALGLSKTRIAAALGISRQTFYDLLARRQSVTPIMALKFERAFGGSAEMWMNLQRDYDLAVTREEKAEDLACTEHLEVEPA